MYFIKMPRGYVLGTPYVINMFPDPDTQGLCGPPYVLELAWALYHVGTIAGDQLSYLKFFVVQSGPKSCFLSWLPLACSAWETSRTLVETLQFGKDFYRSWGVYDIMNKVISQCGGSSVNKPWFLWQEFR